MKKAVAGYAASKAGFTLAELLVGLGLSATVLALLAAFFINLSRASTLQNAAAGAQHSARAAMDYLIQDIRMAGFDPLKTAGAGIEEISASGNKLRFSADRCNQPVASSGCPSPEPDGDLDDDSETVTYFYDVGQRSVKRCLYELPSTFNSDAVSGSCQVLISKVVANPEGLPVFSFFDDEDDPITDNNDRARIRSVVVTLTVEENAGGSSKVARSYSSRLRLRNIGM